MARFPKVQNPCPYKSQLAQVMDGDTCRMCKRVVHDLSGMDDAGRLAFMNDCVEEVCVSYRFPVARTLAAAAIAMAAVAAPMAAAAQDVDEFDGIIVGGITNIGRVEYIEDPADQALPELPVVYEDTAAQPATAKIDTAPEDNTAPVAAKT